MRNIFHIEYATVLTILDLMKTCISFSRKPTRLIFSDSTQKWSSENTIQSPRTNWGRVSRICETVITYVSVSISEIMQRLWHQDKINAMIFISDTGMYYIHITSALRYTLVVFINTHKTRHKNHILRFSPQGQVLILY
jgi:hypothetical protein